MKLHEMKSTPGSRHSRKRVGRGTGSGWGKTAGRGENGQKSRSGFKNKIGFEGGQNPLYRRIPKRGFNNINTIEYSIINVEKLQALGLTIVTPESLIEVGVLKNSYGRLKVLGNGEISTAIEVSAHKFSKSAVAAIEKAGGKVIILGNGEAPVSDKAVKVKKQVTVEEKEEFDAKTVEELKEIAKDKGITGISGLKKAELIAKIREA